MLAPALIGVAKSLDSMFEHDVFERHSTLDCGFVSSSAVSGLSPLFFFSFSLDYLKTTVIASSATMALAVRIRTRR